MLQRVAANSALSIPAYRFELPNHWEQFPSNEEWLSWWSFPAYAEAYATDGLVPVFIVNFSHLLAAEPLYEPHRLMPRSIEHIAGHRSRPNGVCFSSGFSVYGPLGYYNFVSVAALAPSADALMAWEVEKILDSFELEL